MKVLLLVTGLGMGGAEKVVTSLADGLAAKGHGVLIAYLVGAAVILPMNASIKVVSLGMISKIDAVRAFFKIRQLIRAFQPDVVHSHMLHANILARLVRLTTPITRLISTAHASNEGGMLRMLAYRMTDSLADISTNVSAEAVAAFINVKASRPGRMIAVCNGISTNRFVFSAVARSRIRKELMIDEDYRLLLAVGRLHEQKDYPNLFHAFAEISVKAQLLIAGDGPLRGALEALAVRLGIAARVRFLGVRHDVADLMSAADIFVLSSSSEGFGLVVAEAMSCKRIVVATDCGGVREVVGEAGYLVQPKDSKALAQALQTALQLSAIEVRALECAARKRVVDKFSLDTVIKKWLQLYLTEDSVAK